MSLVQVLCIGLTAALSGHAHADTVLDTFYAGDVSTSPGSSISRNDSEDQLQQQGQSFSLTTTTTITDILMAIHGNGTVRLGIEGSIAGSTPSTIGYQVPDANFIFSTMFSNPAANYQVSSLNWTLTPGQYWLVAMPETNGTTVYWQAGLDPNGSHVAIGDKDFHGNNFWYFSDPGSLATRINGMATAVPEPANAFLMLAGLAAMGIALRRRSREG